ncbi:MAG: hypothetical protein C4527_18055 [Candidatus Omnitrophota bacterium]|jgi:beta-lactamase regulating signal transducer with metallopeptidase domain/DUF4097 and DUF4098 domain-containing protein YvlB|nr:MAG: hypothetical protein C4527_18055 [Candidatus Omnitrophota bacterium]
MIDGETFNQSAQVWGEWMWARTIDTTIVFFIVGAIWLLLRKNLSPHFGYALFLLVLVKLWLPYQASLPPFVISMLDGNPYLDHLRIPAIDVGLQERKVWNIDSNDDSSIQSFIPNRKDPTIRQIANTDKKVKTVFQSAVIEKQTLDEMERFSPSPQKRTIYNSFASLSVCSCLFLIWIVIVGILFSRFVYHEWITSIRIRQSDILDPKQLPIDFDQLCAIANVRRDVRLATNSWVRSPFVYGIFSPYLFIPENLFTQNSPNQIRWIFLHELAHIRRWDTAVRLLQKFSQYLFFYHPVVWLTNKFIDLQREFSCDESAVLGTNASPSECGKGLMGIILQVNQTPFWMPASIGMFNSKTIIKERLMRILDSNRSLCSGLSFHAGICLVVLSLVILPFTTTASNETMVLNSEGENSAGGMPAASAQAAVGADSVLATNASFPNDGYTIQDNKYVWKRALQVKTESIESAEFKTLDGDIEMTCQTDPDVKTIDVDADIVITKKREISEEEALRLKEKIDIVVETKDRKVIVRVQRPNTMPKGIDTYVDMRVKVPAGINLAASSVDGDITAGKLTSSIAFTTTDGDICIIDCSGPAALKTTDGDLEVTNCPGQLVLHSVDGDITTTNCSGAIQAKTVDGDITAEQCPGPVEANTVDGDIDITNAKNKIMAQTTDGSISLVFDSAPGENCTFKTVDGDVSIDAPDDAKLNLVLQTNEGDINIPEENFTGVKNKKQIVGALNGGGVSMVVSTGEGSITIK